MKLGTLWQDNKITSLVGKQTQADNTLVAD